uniref:Uncharacterized protein n=1 Tax=Chromera velia CCMP2878 TaxID=1169474 RepID=A0A0G4HMP5_9ALVE|eukprot:Cvel_29266.t1-p1 / transcript=Cvel_29266.t1 / gene=Cvel_29266 / organism=Chromera_velia_CCMP2878 / gene_product=hypothetical protein / transcript_product=hypothetical protein / location=Cvel_scaffold3970:2740-12283(+) / protein_length=1822 / sequence_SO=supercontig / SO=protein_coding / is_pseudo=false
MTASLLQQFALPHGKAEQCSDEDFCQKILHAFDDFSDPVLKGLKEDLANFVSKFGCRLGEEELFEKLKDLKVERSVFIAAGRDGAVRIKKADCDGKGEEGAAFVVSVFNKLPSDTDFLQSLDGVAVSVPHYTAITAKDRLLQPFCVKQLSELTSDIRRTSTRSLTSLLTDVFIPSVMTRKDEEAQPIQKVLKNKLETSEGDKAELMRGPLAMHFDIFLHTTLVEAYEASKGEVTYQRLLLSAFAEALNDWLEAPGETKNSSLCDRSIARLTELQVALAVLLEDSAEPLQTERALRSACSKSIKRVAEVIKKGRRMMEEGWKAAQSRHAKKSSMTIKDAITPEAISAAAHHDFSDAMKYSEYAQEEWQSAEREKTAQARKAAPKRGQNTKLIHEDIDYGCLPSITGDPLLSGVLRVLEGGEKPAAAAAGKKKGKGGGRANLRGGEDKWSLESRIAELERYIVEILWRLSDEMLADEAHFGVQNLKRLSEKLTELFEKTQAQKERDLRSLSRYLLCRITLTALMDRILSMDAQFGAAFREFVLPIPSFMSEHLVLEFREEYILLAEIEEHIANRARLAKAGNHAVSLLSSKEDADEWDAPTFQSYFVKHVGELAKLKRRIRSDSEKREEEQEEALDKAKEQLEQLRAAQDNARSSDEVMAIDQQMRKIVLVPFEHYLPECDDDADYLVFELTIPPALAAFRDTIAKLWLDFVPDLSHLRQPEQPASMRLWTGASFELFRLYKNRDVGGNSSFVFPTTEGGKGGSNCYLSISKPSGNSNSTQQQKRQANNYLAIRIPSLNYSKNDEDQWGLYSEMFPDRAGLARCDPKESDGKTTLDFLTPKIASDEPKHIRSQWMLNRNSLPGNERETIARIEEKPPELGREEWEAMGTLRVGPRNQYRALQRHLEQDCMGLHEKSVHSVLSLCLLQAGPKADYKSEDPPPARDADGLTIFHRRSSAAAVFRLGEDRRARRASDLVESALREEENDPEKRKRAAAEAREERTKKRKAEKAAAAKEKKKGKKGGKGKGRGRKKQGEDVSDEDESEASDEESSEEEEEEQADVQMKCEEYAETDLGEEDLPDVRDWSRKSHEWLRDPDHARPLLAVVGRRVEERLQSWETHRVMLSLCDIARKVLEFSDSKEVQEEAAGTMIFIRNTLFQWIFDDITPLRNAFANGHTQNRGQGVSGSGGESEEERRSERMERQAEERRLRFLAVDAGLSLLKTFDSSPVFAPLLLRHAHDALVYMKTAAEVYDNLQILEAEGCDTGGAAASAAETPAEQAFRDSLRRDYAQLGVRLSRRFAQLSGVEKDVRRHGAPFLAVPGHGHALPPCFVEDFLREHWEGERSLEGEEDEDGPMVDAVGREEGEEGADRPSLGGGRPSAGGRSEVASETDEVAAIDVDNEAVEIETDGDWRPKEFAQGQPAGCFWVTANLRTESRSGAPAGRAKNAPGGVRLVTADVELLSGRYLIKGRPSSFLPKSIQRDCLVEDLIGDRQLEVRPDPKDPETLIQRHAGSSGSRLCFSVATRTCPLSGTGPSVNPQRNLAEAEEEEEGEEGDEVEEKSVVIVRERQADGTSLLLIPRQYLRSELPHELAEGFTHWLCETEKKILFRPASAYRAGGTGGDQGIGKERFVAYLDKKLLVDANSPIRPQLLLNPCASLSKALIEEGQLKRLDAPPFIHLYASYSDDFERSRRSSLEELSPPDCVLARICRLNLNFRIQANSQPAEAGEGPEAEVLSLDFHADTQPRMKVSRNQSLGTLVGLQHGLLLEERDKREGSSGCSSKRVLVIPSASDLEMRGEGADSGFDLHHEVSASLAFDCLHTFFF